MSLPVISDTIRADAVHGSFCPKLCNYACPVVEATGREDATPWSFHRTIADVATGRRDITADDAHQLRGCTGCLACQGACEPGIDVPAQVVAGREAALVAGVAQPEVQTALDDVAAGRSPFGSVLPADLASEPTEGVADVCVVVGCRDDRDVVAAAVRLLASAGVATQVVVPDGCCGGVLSELGARAAADVAATTTRSRITAPTVLALDPHCAPALADGDRVVVDPASYLAELVVQGRLRLGGADGPMAYHDPCLTARRDGVTDPARALLTAAGFTLVEPEGHGSHTVCSGAGLGAELLAPADAVAVAGRRAVQLLATQAPVATGCSGARARLASAGSDVGDLLVILAAHIVNEESA